MHLFLERATELKDQITGWRRQIHENPELGVENPNTAKLVYDALCAMGYAPQFMGGGVVAVVEGRQSGKTFLLRGDMDALPMQEESGLSFASKVPGVSHTCGHDTHTAMLLGAAKILMENKEMLNGRVKLMFQPGEEVGLGAKQMIAAGVLENPAVDACMGMHSMVATEIPSGKLCCYEELALASGDVFTIEVTGKGTHGSRPETGIDPINILCHIHSMLQTIGTREKPQMAPAVITIGQISSGNAPNAIANNGFMRGTIRTFDSEVQAFVKKRLKEISEQTAKALGGEAVVQFETGMLPTINNVEVAAQITSYFKELVGDDNVCIMPPRMASEDFSEVMSRVPGTFVRLSMGSREEGYTCEAHHPQNVLNEETMTIGAAAYAYAALRWLENN